MRYLLSCVEAVGGSSLIECLSGSAGLGWAGLGFLLRVVVMTSYLVGISRLF